MMVRNLVSRRPNIFFSQILSFLIPILERYVPPHLRRNPQELFHNDPRNPVNFPSGGGGYHGGGSAGGRDGGFRGMKGKIAPNFQIHSLQIYSLLIKQNVYFDKGSFCSCKNKRLFV